MDHFTLNENYNCGYSNVDRQMMYGRLLCGSEIFFVDKNYKFGKDCRLNGTCGWHEKCGHSHQYVHLWTAQLDLLHQTRYH